MGPGEGEGGVKGGQATHNGPQSHYIREALEPGQGWPQGRYNTGRLVAKPGKFHCSPMTRPRDTLPALGFVIAMALLVHVVPYRMVGVAVVIIRRKLSAGAALVRPCPSG